MAQDHHEQEEMQHGPFPVEQLQVSVIQPISGCGLAILCVFSHFYLQEMMNAIDWMGIALAGIVTIGVGAGGEEQETSSISIFHLPWLAFAVAILFVYFGMLDALLASEELPEEYRDHCQSEATKEEIDALRAIIKCCRLQT